MSPTTRPFNCENSLDEDQGSTGDDFSAGAGDRHSSRGRGRDRRCPYDNPGPGYLTTAGAEAGATARMIKNEVLTFRESRKSIKNES